MSGALVASWGLGMASKIDQLIGALAGALRDFDAGLGSMPREELADVLALAGAADEEHRAAIRKLSADAEAAEHEAEQRGWEHGHEWHARERDQMQRERDDALADAAKVRRGARCLRERCRRLESLARGAEERANIARTAALYAWRMRDANGGPPVWMYNVLAFARRAVVERYGAEFAATGEAALRIVLPEVSDAWPNGETDNGISE